MYQLQGSLNYKLFKPAGSLASHVQGIWSANVEAENVEKKLYSDAGSGIYFVLNCSVCWGGVSLAPGIWTVPTADRCTSITLPSGSRLAGLRFHPAAGYSFLGDFRGRPRSLSSSDPRLARISVLHADLHKVCSHYGRIVALYRWLLAEVGAVEPVPESVRQALRAMHQESVTMNLEQQTVLGQRQVERLFKQRVGITPKRVHRIIRVKNTVDRLKKGSVNCLSSLALESGFSDQAHMVREFRAIADTTPGRLKKLGQQ